MRANLTFYRGQEVQWHNYHEIELSYSNRH
jgi:hypothetical protein